MEKLAIKVDGKAVQLEYTQKFAKGIYLVAGKKSVLKNCDVLGIAVEKVQNAETLQNRVSKIGKFVVVPMIGEDIHIQHIFFSSAEPKDFNDLLKDIPPASYEILRQAFNLSRVSTLADLNLIGGIASDSN